MRLTHGLDVCYGVLVAPQPHIHDVLLSMIMPQVGILIYLEG